MDFVSNAETQIRDMLKTIGIQSIDELFQAIPLELRVAKPKHDDGLSELEGVRLIESIAAKNSYPRFENYLGAGAYEHHVPAIISSLCSKGEFLSSYTPYQAEASQGMLQAIFEFQSAVCALTGLDVSNASLYDGASACAEAALMALRCHPERKRVVVAASLNPFYQKVIHQYVNKQEYEIVTVPYADNGHIDLPKLTKALKGKPACVILGYPNFFGIIEEWHTVIPLIKAAGTFTILSANPLVYGVYASAAELGAEIAVGDLQPFGMPLNFGGPYVGYIACKQEYVRQLPGRIVGETVDVEGRPGFVLTLQAREQHIRREKATSNICTNVALAALATLIGMAWYGKEGVAKLALTNYQRAAYLREALAKLPQVKIYGMGPFFNEFAVSFGCPAKKALKQFRKHQIEPGVLLSECYPKFKNTFLVCVTEMKTKQQLDRYVEVAKGLNAER